MIKCMTYSPKNCCLAQLWIIVSSNLTAIVNRVEVHVQEYYTYNESITVQSPGTTVNSCLPEYGEAEMTNVG